MVWVYVWLGVLALSLIIEFVTMELISIWISVGSLLSMILALCKVDYTIQIIVFAVVTVACILGLRKVTMKLLFRNKDKTNLDTLVGKTFRLIKGIGEEPGLIKVNGVEWEVKSENDETIDTGLMVEIVSVEGNKFIVRKSKSKNAQSTDTDNQKTLKEESVDSSASKETLVESSASNDDADKQDKTSKKTKNTTKNSNKK